MSCTCKPFTCNQGWSWCLPVLPLWFLRRLVCKFVLHCKLSSLPPSAVAFQCRPQDFNKDLLMMFFSQHMFSNRNHSVRRSCAGNESGMTQCYRCEPGSSNPLTGMTACIPCLTGTAKTLCSSSEIKQNRLKHVLPVMV